MDIGTNDVCTVEFGKQSFDICSTRGSAVKVALIDKSSRSNPCLLPVVHVGGCICNAHYQLEFISLSLVSAAACIVQQQNPS